MTVADISAEMGAPVGSIYYRCATRTHVLISLWLRCIARFQAGILEVAPAQFSRSATPDAVAASRVSLGSRAFPGPAPTGGPRPA